MHRYLHQRIYHIAVPNYAQIVQLSYPHPSANFVYLSFSPSLKHPLSFSLSVRCLIHPFQAFSCPYLRCHHPTSCPGGKGPGHQASCCQYLAQGSQLDGWGQTAFAGGPCRLLCADSNENAKQPARVQYFDQGPCVMAYMAQVFKQHPGKTV